MFWLEDPDSFEQFTVQPVDLGSSLQEEEKDLRYCTLLVGLDPFTSSGNAPVDDPSAPGNKTIALINQGNLRMEEPISEIRKGIEEIGNIDSICQIFFLDHSCRLITHNIIAGRIIYCTLA